MKDDECMTLLDELYGYAMQNDDNKFHSYPRIGELRDLIQDELSIREIVHKPVITRDMLDEYLMSPLCCGGSDCCCRGASVYDEIRHQILHEEMESNNPIEGLADALKDFNEGEQDLEQEVNTFVISYDTENVIRELFERAGGKS